MTNVYDGFGRLASSSINMGGITRTLAYQYDPAGNRIRITHPDGHYFSTPTTTPLSRPGSLWANGVSGMPVVRLHAGRAAGGIGRANGATSEWGYDGALRLEQPGPPSGRAQRTTSPGASPTTRRARSPRQTRDNDAYAWTGHYAVNRDYATNGLNHYTAAGERRRSPTTSTAT